MICVKLAVKSKHDQKTLKKKNHCRAAGTLVSQENPATPDGQSTPAGVANPCFTNQNDLAIGLIQCLSLYWQCTRCAKDLAIFFRGKNTNLKKKNSQEKLNWAMMVVKLHFLLSVIQMCSSRHIWWFFKHGKFTSTQ